MAVSTTKRSMLLQDGIRLYHAGDRRQARFMVRVAADADPGNELVWFWRAGLARNREEAVEHLDAVLRLNPANHRARMWKDRFVSRPQVASTVAAGSGEYRTSLGNLAAATQRRQFDDSLESRETLAAVAA